MIESFQTKKEATKFDSININCYDLWKEYPPDGSRREFKTFERNLFRCIYRCPIIPIKFRRGLWYLLNKIHLDTFWLDCLNYYWTKILKQRPIHGVLDFAFFLGVHRRLFHNLKLDIEDNSDLHLKVFQSPPTIYMLLAFAYRGSYMSYFHHVNLAIKYGSRHATILEFGAGICPVTSTFVSFSLNRGGKFIVCDIETIYFHYGCMKLSAYPNVSYVTLQPDNNFMMDCNTNFDVIYCLEVFEHLPSPLKVVEMFYKLLNSDGLLIFDYIISVGDGLDTKAGIKERSKVLLYIKEHFKLIEGDLSNIENSIGLTVVRK